MNHSGSLVITGGCGFIGTNLLFRLLRRGFFDRIVIVDNLSVGRLEDLADVLEECGLVRHPAEGGSNSRRHSQEGARLRWEVEIPDARADGKARVQVEFHRHDLRSPEALAEIIQGAGAVVHLAAQTGVIPSMKDPVSDMDNNVRGTLNLLEACRTLGIKRFIFASSGAPLGEQTPPIDETKVPRPISPYGASKLAGEGYCSAYCGSFGLETVALRFSNVYGPRSTLKNSVVARFIKNVLAVEPIIVYGSGEQTRDFIYVDDLCSAIEKALTTTEPSAYGTAFQIATFRESTVNEIAERIKKLAEEDSFGSVRVVHEAERAGEVKRSFSDISRARKLLGFLPEYDLDAGLRATWEWFLARGDNIRPLGDDHGAN